MDSDLWREPDDTIWALREAAKPGGFMPHAKSTAEFLTGMETRRQRDLRVTLRRALALLDEHKRGDPLRNNPVVGWMSEAQAESILEEMREERRR